MKKLFTSATLSGRIRIYSACMVCIPLLFITVVLVFFVRSGIIEESQKTLLEQARSHKVVIEEWFDERINNVKFLAELEVVKKGELPRSRAIFEAFDNSHDDISTVALVGANGKTIFDTLNNTRVVDVSDRQYFIEAKNGTPHVTEVIIGRKSGRPIIIFAHPVTHTDGSFGGLVFIASRLTQINALMNHLQFGDSGETYILNRAGYMLTESRFLDGLKAQGRVKKTAVMTIKMNSNVFSEAMKGGQPQGPYHDYRNRAVLGASQWTKEGNWLIVSEIDYSETLKQLFPFILTLTVAYTLTIALLLPMLYRLGRSITFPLYRLSKMADSMTQGQFTSSQTQLGVNNPPREIAQLGKAFFHMQEKVNTTVQELEKTAITDQLTSLPNRRCLMTEGSRIVSLSIRAKQPCTLFMMDIDHFKPINDTFGHLTGDRVLKQVAQVLHDTVRSSDLIARYGGEEFAVIAPGTGIQSARELAERFRQKVEAATFNTDENPLSCTISIGVAPIPNDIKPDADALEEMISRADKALYDAKAAGRNRVVINGEYLDQ